MLNFEDRDRALIIGSSGGIGSALVKLLKKKLGEDRVNTVNRETDGFNFFDPESVERVANLFRGPYRLIFDATGGLEINEVPPEKSLRALDPENMQNHFLLNTIGPALILKHFCNAHKKSKKKINNNINFNCIVIIVYYVFVKKFREKYSLFFFPNSNIK